MPDAVNPGGAGFTLTVNGTGFVPGALVKWGVGELYDQKGNCRGFIWQDGVMTDLNSLVLPGSSLYLVNISDINNRGEVADYAYNPNTGEAPGFVAIPCDAHHADVEDCAGQADRASAADKTGTRPKMILPESVRQLLQRRSPFQRH